MKLQFETTKFMQLLKGFSLIELMIVVAIIGVLASIALPAYEGYIFRARMSHLMSMSTDIKSKLTEYRALNGTWPAAFSAAYNYQQGTDPYIAGVWGTATGTGNNDYKVGIAGMSTGLTGGDPMLRLYAAYTAGSATTPAAVVWSCTVWQQAGAVTGALSAQPTPNATSAGQFPASYFTADCPNATSGSF